MEDTIAFLVTWVFQPLIILVALLQVQNIWQLTINSLHAWYDINLIPILLVQLKFPPTAVAEPMSSDYARHFINKISNMRGLSTKFDGLLAPKELYTWYLYRFWAVFIHFGKLMMTDMTGIWLIYDWYMKVVQIIGLWMKVNAIGWTWMKVNESGWEWIKKNESGWKWMKVD